MCVCVCVDSCVLLSICVILFNVGVCSLMSAHTYFETVCSSVLCYWTIIYCSFPVCVLDVSINQYAQISAYICAQWLFRLFVCVRIIVVWVVFVMQLYVFSLLVCVCVCVFGVVCCVIVVSWNSVDRVLLWSDSLFPYIWQHVYVYSLWDHFGDRLHLEIYSIELWCAILCCIIPGAPR